MHCTICEALTAQEKCLNVGCASHGLSGAGGLPASALAAERPLADKPPAAHGARTATGGQAASGTTKRAGALFIIGAAGSGKTTAAKFIAEELRERAGDPGGWGICETGDLIAARLAGLLAQVPMETPLGLARNGEEWWREEIRGYKSLFREALAVLGDSLCDAQGDYWIDQALRSNSRIVVGARREREARARFERGFDDVWILVERYGREEVGTFEGAGIAAAVPEHFWIANGRDFGALREECRKVARVVAQYWRIGE